jgi:hypothetical protein
MFNSLFFPFAMAPLEALGAIEGFNLLPATLIEAYSDVIFNGSQPLEVMASSRRILRGLVERQTCPEAGYSLCPGYSGCCPSGGYCCISGGVVACPFTPHDIRSFENTDVLIHLTVCCSGGRVFSL